MLTWNGLATPGFNVLKQSVLKDVGSKSTMKMPSLLDLTNKKPFGGFIPESPDHKLKAPVDVFMPSSARKSIRAPRISGESLKAKELLAPFTPAPLGRRKHWEILSPGDVSMEEAEGEVEQQQPDLEDEIEYAPPPVTG